MSAGAPSGVPLMTQCAAICPETHLFTIVNFGHESGRPAAEASRSIPNRGPGISIHLQTAETTWNTAPWSDGGLGQVLRRQKLRRRPRGGWVPTSTNPSSNTVPRPHTLRISVLNRCKEFLHRHTHHRHRSVVWFGHDTNAASPRFLVDF